MTMPIDPDKYLVFKREDLEELLNPGEVGILLSHSIPDAVVIRRQDRFASPCLLTYAAMISMVAENHPITNVQMELLAIADYFHHQGVLAGEEGYKLPSI